MLFALFSEISKLLDKNIQIVLLHVVYQSFCSIPEVKQLWANSLLIYVTTQEE